MYVAAFGPPEALIFRGTHLLFALTLVFLLYPTRPGARRRGARSISRCSRSASASCCTSSLNYDYFINRIIYIDDLTSGRHVLRGRRGGDRARGDAARHRPGAADHRPRVPGLRGRLHARDARTVLLEQLYLSTEGIFGSTLGVSASYVMLFVLFGAFMERSGTGQLFMDFAMSLTGHTAGGPGQGGGRFVEPVRHRLGQRGRQRHGRRADHDSADEAHRLPAAVRRRRSRRSRRPAARSCRRSWARPRS